MPVTLPAGIAALIGEETTAAPVVLMEWLLPSPVYYSSGKAVTWGGHTWEGNRLKGFPSFTLGIFDRKGREFPKLNITISNLANNGSAAFPIHGLDAAQDLENWPVKIYFYSPDAADGFLRWSGYSGKPTYHGADKSANLSCTFIFDSLNIPFPFRTQSSLGFGTLDTNRNKGSAEETMIPLVWGVGPSLAARPMIYSAWVEGGQLHVNFIVSGCADGQPFLLSDIERVELYGNTEATTFEMGGLGSAGQAAPANLTRFPDGQAHPRVCYGYAAFPIPNELKDSLDSLKPEDIKLWLAGGRRLAATGLPSENGVLIIKDLLTDTYFGIGLAASDFDATAVTAAANYVGTRYRSRVELHESEPLMDLIQKLLGDIHCYITFADKIQIRAKGTAEVSVATFATADSGQAGRKIIDDYVDEVTEEDSGSLINDVLITYRKKNRSPFVSEGRKVHVYDPNAQSFTPGSFNKPTREELDSSLVDETEVSRSGAIMVREEQSGNLFPTFRVPFWDGCDIVAGDIITVHSVDIFGNVSNYLFRVLTQTFDPNAAQIGFRGKVYKPAIYNDDTLGLGTDLLRGGQDTSQSGRPPDVTPISLTIVDVSTNDTESRVATMRAAFTVPAFDPASEQAEGVFREPPISEVEIWWSYVDENIEMARRGGSQPIIQQATPVNTSLDFQVDYQKSRSVIAFFVTLGPSRGRSPLGWVPDSTKVTPLTANLSATSATANVANTAAFAVNDIVQCEKEKMVLVGKTSNTLTFRTAGGVREAVYFTTAIAHPAGTEIAVAKLSYPWLIRSLLQPRFTYPVVTARDILQRGGDGVRVRWLDADPENLERYHVAYSMDADAETNVNKLGSATPAWYLNDPLLPPSGVVVVAATKQKALLIPQEDIGPVGTVVRARIFARNGKRNFSSALSGLLNSSVAAAGGTSPPTDAPSPPFLAYLIENVPEMTPEGLRARCRFGVFANATGTKTFAQTGATSVVLVFQLPGGGKLRPEFFIDDTSLFSIDVVWYFSLGDPVIWVKNVARNAGGHLDSTVGNLPFFAGGSQTNAANITGLAISSIAPIDDKHSYINWQYTQPAAPVLISHAIILRQLAGEGSYTRAEKIKLLDEVGNQTAGVKSFSNPEKHPKKTVILWKVRLISVDGTSIESAPVSNTSQDEDTAAPNNGVAIAITRCAMKHGRAILTEPVMPTLQMASFWRTTLIIHDNGFVGGIRRYYDPATETWGTTLVELVDAIPTVPITKLLLFSGGRTTVYVKVGIWNRFNGGSVTYSADVPALGAGQIQSSGAGNEPALGDTGVPSSLLAPDVQDHFGTLEVSCPPPGTNHQTVKRYQCVLSTQATAPAGAPTVGLEGVQKIKNGAASAFRNKQGATVTIFFYYRVENDFGFSGWSPGTSVTGTTIGRPLDDFIGSGVPALPMALERNATSGNGHTLTTFVLDAGANQALNYYAGMALHVQSLNAGDAVRNITASIFSGGVVTVTVDTPYSATPGNAIIFEIHRGHVLAGKSGSGHSLTSFILPAAASSVNDFYNGMMLWITTAASSQRLHRITDYVGSTRAATIEAIESGLSSVPANNCGFLISVGSFGYASSNGTGVIAPVPVRLWYNDELATNVGEAILPSGENAYSSSDFQYQVVRKNNGVTRDDKKIAITSSSAFTFPLPSSYTPMVRIRFRNLFRSGGSDGWGPWSHYTPAARSDAPPATTFSPGVYVPVEVDPTAEANQPTSFYQTY